MSLTSECSICIICFVYLLAGLLDALKHSGLQYLLNASASVINNEEHNIVNINHQYECAWRLSDWNIPWSQVTINAQHYSRVRFQNPVTNDYSLYRYQTLRSFHDHDTDGFKTALKSARINAIKTLRNVSLGKLCNSYDNTLDHD